jgi:hypothetical protein
MFIIIKNNDSIYFNTNNDFNSYLNSDINLNEIKEICIFQETIDSIQNINFQESNYKLKINHCNLPTLPNNIPNNIQNLDLSYNNLTIINTQALLHLKILKINNNKIVNLILQENLEILYCNNNKIPQFNNIPENLLFLNICNNLLIEPINPDNNLNFLQSNNLFNSQLNVNSDTVPILNIIGYISVNEEIVDETNYLVQENDNDNYEDIEDNINFIIQNIQTEYTNIPEIQNLYNQPINNIDNNIDNEINNEINNEIEQVDSLEILNEDNKNENKDSFLKEMNKIHNLSDENRIEIPNNFICPISKSIFYNPVCLSDGFSYEKSYIQEWIKNNNKSPMTNKTLKNKNIVKNHLLRGLILDWIDKINTLND